VGTKAALTTFGWCIATAISFAQPVTAQAVDLDQSTEVITSCEPLKLPAAMEGITVVSWSEGSKICQTTTGSLGHPITVGIFRSFLKIATVIKYKDGGELDKIAYQLAEIVEARGIAEPKRMLDTLDIAMKCFNGSHGRVTPKDLNVALRQSGQARTLTDDDLYTLAAVISVRKRNNGE
jgi:hypothetical protein